MSKQKTHTVRIHRHNPAVYFNHEFELTNDNRYLHTEYPHMDIWIGCLNMLIKKGVRVLVDPRVKKDYPILSPMHKYFNWKGLECDIEIYPVGFKFGFYQNINCGDRKPGDGKYAFNQFSLMPYLIRLRFLHIAELIAQYLSAELGIAVEYLDKPTDAAQQIIQSKQGSCHNRKPPVNSLEDFQAQMSDYDLSSNNNDRDKKKIMCGQVKYFRDRYTGRLMRGRVYHNLNNQWYVLLNKYEWECRSAGELFDPTPEDFAQPRRIRKGSIPAEKKRTLDLLHSLSPAKLKHLLHRQTKNHHRHETAHSPA